jgi:hypothetical protein
MKKTIMLLVLAALLAASLWACGCGTEESIDREEKVTTTQTTGEDTTTTTQTTGEELEPGPRYDPYPTPEEGEMVTPTDYDVGLREGYEYGYWAGYADGMRGIYDEQPGEYDDTNEYYEEGYLEGYQEGYDDGNSDGEEM